MILNEGAMIALLVAERGTSGCSGDLVAFGGRMLCAVR